MYHDTQFSHSPLVDDREGFSLLAWQRLSDVYRLDYSLFGRPEELQPALPWLKSWPLGTSPGEPALGIITCVAHSLQIIDDVLK